MVPVPESVPWAKVNGRASDTAPLALPMLAAMELPEAVPTVKRS